MANHPSTNEDDYEPIASYGDWDYQWSCIDVWRRKKDGMLVTDEDAGCSCYGPYDDAKSDDEVVEITNWISFRDEVPDWGIPFERQEFLHAVWEAWLATGVRAAGP